MSSTHGGSGRGNRRVVRAFAHRGGSYTPGLEGLENTLHAFKHAVDLGYRYLETDVHLTADGVLLAFHDAVLDRVTDRTGSVADLTLAEVREARVGGAHQVPTLAELFDAFPGVTFNIDLKASGTPAALAAFLDERTAHDRVIVGSFGVGRLREFRRLTRHRVRTSAHQAEVIAFLLCPSGVLANLLSGGRAVAFQVPHRHRVGGRQVTVVSRGFIRRAHAAGKEVHVWTVDDPDEMRELIDMGVDGLMTDRTDILKQVLTERELWQIEGQA